MSKQPLGTESKSAERLAFEVFLRTGRRIAPAATPERKFNPYHDPRNGQFTFAPGGPQSIADPMLSGRRSLLKPAPMPTGGATRAALDKSPGRRVAGTSGLNPPETAPQDGFVVAGLGGRPPRRGRGRAGRRRADDPVLLEQAFPGLERSPAGAIVRMADGILDLTSAAQDATRELHRARVRRLVAEIRAIDPDYHFESLGEPDSIEGRANEIKALRFRRALAYYRQRNDLRPLQLEVVRIMQERTDEAYEVAVKRYDAGRLTPRLSREEAIGNYVDLAVRRQLRIVFNVNRVDISRGQPIRVVGREYDSSVSDRTYRVPDARVGNVAIDVTLTEKTLSTAQVRGFFGADFKPDAVVIIRPSQLGGSYAYAIKRPGE